MTNVYRIYVDRVTGNYGMGDDLLTVTMTTGQLKVFDSFELEEDRLKYVEDLLAIQQTPPEPPYLNPARCSYPLLNKLEDPHEWIYCDLPHNHANIIGMSPRHHYGELN